MSYLNEYNIIIPIKLFDRHNLRYNITLIHVRRHITLNSHNNILKPKGTCWLKVRIVLWSAFGKWHSYSLMAWFQKYFCIAVLMRTEYTIISKYYSYTECMGLSLSNLSQLCIVSHRVRQKAVLPYGGFSSKLGRYERGFRTWCYIAVKVVRINSAPWVDFVSIKLFSLGIRKSRNLNPWFSKFLEN